MKHITCKLFTLLMLFTVFSIKLQAQCVAGFTHDAYISNGQYGTGLVQFTDTSHATFGDTIVTYAWDFGDGVTANVKNPVHYYPVAGNYTITLFVTDNSSTDGEARQLLMNVPYPHGCKAYINYTFTYPYPAPPIPTLFLSTANIIPSNDGIASVLWDFGDGTTSTLLNPVHTFPQDTLYTVNYTITTTNGCTSTHAQVITGQPCQMGVTAVPNATDTTKFDVNITNGVPPYQIQWQQISDHASWAYTPASQLSNNNQTLQALDTTAYIVFVTGANGCSNNWGYASLNGYQYNWNFNYDVVANFVFLQQSGNSLIVDFGDNSQSGFGLPTNIVSQSWDFGDGGTSTIPNPQHTYGAYGSYTITYIVQDANGSIDTNITNINILHCNYTFTSSIAPPTGNNNILVANSTGGVAPLSYIWNIGNVTTQSITATNAAYYSVQISDANGCLASLYTWTQLDAGIQYNSHFQDSCTANFGYGVSYSSTDTMLTFFAEEGQWGYLKNPHTYTWTFSDGYLDPYAGGVIDNRITQRSNPQPTAPYNVTLNVTGGGCNASKTLTVDFAPTACNLSPFMGWSTNNYLFMPNNYPLRISASTFGGHGSYQSMTYLWNTGSTAPMIYAYTTGTYCCTVTDSLGCTIDMCYTYYTDHDSTITLCGNVFNDANNNGVFDSSEIPAGTSNTVKIEGNGNTYNVSIDGTGHYNAMVPAGSYTITYNAGAGHNFTTPAMADTIGVYTNVTAALGNNCGYNFGISNNTSFIGGRLFYDDDSDGISDSTEYGIAYQPITAGSYTVFTDSLGFFNFNVIANTYSLNYTPQNAFAGYTLTTPGTININANTVGGNFSNNNFGIHTANIGADLGVNLWPTSVVNNGFPAHYTIMYYNNGSTSAGNTITLTYDSTRTYSSASIAPLSVDANTHTITWLIPYVNAYTNNYLYVHFNASVALSMNTPVLTTAHISNSSGTETLLANNTSVLNQLSVASFDPNDKLVSSTNSENPTEQIVDASNPDQELEYVIHFQNIGNAIAVNVVVVDELSPLLDENSYVLLGGSHNCQVVRLGNIVTYKFENIMLPTEADAGEASNGFVSFKVNALAGLSVGDLISDQAKIYFDYNQPILTNYANILMVDPTVATDTQFRTILSNAVGVYPNPIKNKGYVKFALDADTQLEIILTDITGKKITQTSKLANKGMNYYELDATNFEPGMYIIKVTGANVNITHKINVINH